MTQRASRHTSQHGSALVIALIFLVALTLIALSASITAMMDERVTRNTRDVTIATEGAEAALTTAENMIATNQIRGDAGFVDCSQTSATGGLCLWTANTVRNDNALYTAYMDKALSDTTGNKARTLTTWPAPNGVRSPRFYIEVMRSRTGGSNLTAQPGDTQFMYRITARGFGQNPAIYVTLESVYRPS